MLPNYRKQIALLLSYFYTCNRLDSVRLTLEYLVSASISDRLDQIESSNLKNAEPNWGKPDELLVDLKP